MAAFTPHDFTLATPDALSELTLSSKFDAHPNFNGQAGIPYEGNFTITAANDLPQGLLWSAHYAVAGPNTITIQFSSPLASASTTTGDYTLTGTSAPSITSVVWNAGSREILLNLSGALSAVNTYTLAIKDRKAISGSQIGYSSVNTSKNTGVYNWPNLVVDVIQPATINVIGVGIEQDIALGTPNVDTAGAAVAVGIEQDIALGVPVVNTLTTAIGVGIEQDIVLGTPSDAPNAVPVATGIAQVVALGTPVVTQEQEPIGVGFVQSIALGTPVADINPLTPTGVGILETIGVGSPVAAGSGNAIGVGIQQNINLGVPTAHKDNEQDTVGVGIEQDIVLGTPLMFQSATMNPLPFDQVIAVGTPNMSYPQTSIGAGFVQPIAVGVPLITNQPYGVGFEVRVDFGVPVVGPPRPRFTTVPDLYPSVVQRWLLRALLDGAVHINTTVEQPLRMTTRVDELV